MTEVVRLDMNMQIADEEGRPTPYFESVFQQLLARTGDESDDFIEDLINQSSFLSLNQKIASINQRLDEIESTFSNQSGLRNSLTSLRNEVEEIRELINRPRINLTTIKQRLDDLEKVS